MAKQWDAGTHTQAVAKAWEAVSFGNTFSSTPVVVTIYAANAKKTGVKDITTTGFSIYAEATGAVCWIAREVGFEAGVPPTTYKVEGVTKDANGNILGSCTVRLYKTSDDSYEDSTISDAVTGAYSFTGLNSDERYIIAYKAGTPVFGTTDDLTPVEE